MLPPSPPGPTRPLDKPFSALDAALRSSLRSEVIQILRYEGVKTVGSPGGIHLSRLPLATRLACDAKSLVAALRVGSDEYPRAALLVTHDQEEAPSVADLPGVMDNGRICQLAGPEELYARPADPTIARLLSEASLLRGGAHGRLASTLIGELSLAGAAPEGSVVVLVRPEQLLLEPARRSAGKPGRVIHREYFGHDSLYLVAPEGLTEPTRARAAGPALFEVGDEVETSPSGKMLAWPAP